MSTGTPEVVGISRSGRVRKKSSKLMEMEETETTEKHVNKRLAATTPTKKTPKNKPVKLKMTIGGAPICEVVEDGEIPIAECAEVYIEEEPQLEIVTEDPVIPPQPPLPPITMKLTASKGTSNAGSASLKSYEVITENRPTSRNEGESETPKTKSRKRKTTVTPDAGNISEVTPEIQSSKPTSSKKSKKQSTPVDPTKPKRTLITGYTLWTREFRPKVQQENPEMDFASVSRRLGEIWQALSNNEKLHWKVKAQKLTGKMSSTGPVAPEPAAVQTPVLPAVRLQSPKHKTQDPALARLSDVTHASAENRLKNIPMTVATHLRVLGESMNSIGYKLQQQDTNNDISGPMSDLLDSLLCALNSLMFLTCMDPKLNGCPISTHLRAMDNVAYIMPGV